MPTGYTAFIEDGDITTGKEFLLLCLRNFGIAIDVRDEPLTVMNGFASTETGNLNTADAIKLVKNISGSADIVKMHMNIPSQQRRSARGKQGGHTVEV